MLSSLFAGISGLNANSNAMAVIGDNIANINTTGFKRSRTSFANILSQSQSFVTRNEIGRGVHLDSVTTEMTQGALEIIYDLEPHQRGVYCGTTGYFFRDEMVLNVAIRTLELSDGRGVLGIGGGIVADSDPEMEYEESLIKAKATMMALGIEM